MKTLSVIVPFFNEENTLMKSVSKLIQANVADQIIKNTTSFPEDAIKLGWDSGYRISDISYGSGYWYIVMDKGKDFGKKRCFTRSSTVDLKNTISQKIIKNNF